MWRKEPTYTAGGSVNWCTTMENGIGFLKKLKIELPNDPAIPLLDIYPDKTIIQKDICSPMFIIAKTWKQPKCLSTEE